MVADLSSIAHLVQLAVAPVFLLTGIAAFLGVLTTRMSRIVDRGHQIVKHIDSGSDLTTHQDEIISLEKRLRFAHRSILFCSLSALVICAVVIMIFVGAFANIEFGLIAASFFCISLGLLIIALTYFLAEVRISIYSIRYAVKIFKNS